VQRIWPLSAVVVGFVLIHCSTTTDVFSPPAVERGKAAAGQVDGEALKKHVANIVQGRTQEDGATTKVALREMITRQNVGKYLTDTYKAMGYEPKLETNNVSVGENTSIVVEIPGERPDVVLLTGHYDAWFQSGADDNGSALAVMLEAARVLKDTKPKRTIRIVAFDREEEGIIGSAEYHREHAADPLFIVLNMDCVGFAKHEDGTQDAPPGLGLRDKGDFLAAIANESAQTELVRFVRLSNDVPRFVDVVGLLAPGNSRNPATGAFLQSDHVPFWDADVPALFLTDTATFRNPHYHTKEDLPDTLDYDFLARTGQLIVGAVAAFAEHE
jgi:Zn-dependent M28 family amino/carboxypeptidase